MIIHVFVFNLTQSQFMNLYTNIFIHGKIILDGAINFRVS